MIYGFGDCVLDAGRRVLLRGGAAVPVEPKVFDLLLLLIERSGSVVSKDALVEAIWDGRAVSDSAITARVAAARRAVGDDGKAQRVIRTVARRGLEFVAPVEVGGEEAGPPPPPPPADRALKIRYARSRTGKSLAYAVTGHGDGLPLVYVGPAMMTDLELIWRDRANQELFRPVGMARPLLLYDPVGCGQSDRRVDSLDFGDLAEDLRLVLDAAGIGRAALMSVSGGAHTVLRLAARHPGRVDRMIVVGGYVEGRDRRSTGPDPIRGLLDAAGRSPGASFGAAFLMAYFPEGPMERLMYKLQTIEAAASPETRMAMRDRMNAVSNAEVLADIRCPTLIVHGRHDAVHPLSEARAMAAGITNAELVVLETANHWPMPGNTVWEDYLETVLAFLAR